MAVVSPILGRTLGHYRVVEQVGAGGMGVVYRAHDERLDRDVALKVLPPGTLADDAARKRFRKEALTLSRLSHTNVAHIYDFDTEDGIDFLVMEFVPGVTLEQRLTECRFPEEEVVRLGGQIARTLEEVSEFGIVHRDLKPANIILSPKGEAKLLDFGLAKLLRTKETEVTQTLGNTKEFAGTLRYMTPEQLKGKPSDFRSDIYSLGVVLYEAATGKQAFDSLIPSVLIDEIVRRSPLPPRQLNPDLSPGLERIILRCLAKDPARRYQSASELSAALKPLESGFSAVSPSPKAHIPRQLGAAALVLFIVTGIFLAWTRRSGPPSPTGAVTRVNELAILPLGASSTDGETAAFGNGLIHTLTARLAQLTGNHSFQVVPASEMRAKGVSSLRDASQEFGANLGLELNIERSGEMLRVNYALVDAKLHRQLQGDTITASMSDPFAIEDKVADSVVKALQIELQPEEQKAQAEHGTNHPVAYDYYLQGQGYLQDYNKPENVENAIVEFNHALRYDPNYSLAFSGLGEAYWREYGHTKQIDWVRQAKSACDRAVRLRPTQASGHLCLGLVNAGTGEYQKSVKEYEIAAQLDPTNDSAYSGLAGAYEQLGVPKEAEETYRKAISLRPSYWAGYNKLGAFYLRSGRYVEASDMFSQVIALAPDSFVGYSNLGISYLLRGDYADASPALEHSLEIRPTAEASSNLGTAYFQLRRYSDAARIFEKAVTLDNHNYEVWGNLADAYYWAPGERAKAKAAYHTALDLAVKSVAVNPRDPSLLGFIADYYAMLGNREPALTYIKKALLIAPKSADLLATAALVFNQVGDTEDALSSLERAVAAGYSKTSLRDTPNFDNLRDQSRLRRLLDLN